MDELIVNNSTLIVVGAMALFYFHVQSDGVTPLVAFALITVILPFVIDRPLSPDARANALATHRRSHASYATRRRWSIHGGLVRLCEKSQSVDFLVHVGVVGVPRTAASAPQSASDSE